VPEVADVARDAGRPVTGVAEAFLRLSERLGIDRLLDRLARARASIGGRWSRAAWHGLFDDLEDLRPLGAREALRRYPSAEESAAVDQLLAARETRLRTALALVADVERDADTATSLDAIAVAARALRRVVDPDG
jgi:NAD-specific glutamate dehydrogenase